jgi:hypothetical protein
VAYLNRGIKKKVGDETFKHFCGSFVGIPNSHIYRFVLWLNQNWDVFAAYKKSLGFVWA